MKLTKIALSYFIGVSYTDAFFMTKKQREAHKESRKEEEQIGRSAMVSASNVNGFHDQNNLLSASNNNPSSASAFGTGSFSTSSSNDNNSDNNDSNYDTSTDSNLYSAPPVMGAAYIFSKQEQQRRNDNRGRSTSGSDNSVQIQSPEQAITEGHEDNVMILSSDYMYVSNCLLKGRHHDDPIRQRAFDLFKQTAAGDWFIVFGYVCNLDYRCWKKSVGNLLSRKGDAYGGYYVGRCVGRLVRDKAEGVRSRRKKRSIEHNKNNE